MVTWLEDGKIKVGDSITLSYPNDTEKDRLWKVEEAYPITRRGCAPDPYDDAMYV